MSRSFADPSYNPPANLSPEEARAYELVILSGLRDALPSGRFGPWIIESIELEGVRPETEIVFTYREIENREQRLVARHAVWEDITHFARGEQVLDPATSVGGWIYSAFTAGELEPEKVP